MFETRASRLLVLGFIIVLAIGLLIPDLSFPLLMIFVGGAVVAGLFQMFSGESSELMVAISALIGFMMIGIMVTEGGHVLAAKASPDLDTVGVNVTFIAWENRPFPAGQALFGWTKVAFDENKLTDPATAESVRGQLSNTIFAGSIAVALIAFLAWAVSGDVGRVAALVWTFITLAHSCPLLKNDTSFGISMGWVGSLAAWGVFVALVGAIVLATWAGIRRRR